MSKYDVRCPQGNPETLAVWAHSALQRRSFGKRFGLVLVGSDRIALVEADTDKMDRIERTRPWAIAGYYTGTQNSLGDLNIEDFESDIRVALKETFS